MVITILSVICLSIIIAIVLSEIENIKRHGNRTTMSFREAMDLVELPVVTFYNKGQKLNFLLDTGSNISQINKSLLPLLDYTKLNDKSSDIIGIEGNRKNTESCKMTITYKGKDFINEFCIHDLDEAFAIVKAESGVQVHGILGSKFFAKYEYVLDFENLIAYYKN